MGGPSLVAGHPTYGGVDAGPTLLNRLDVKPRPPQAAVTNAADNHASHVERRSIRLSAAPAPFAPLGVTDGGGRHELGLEVRNRPEDLRPVLARLVAPAERSIRMRGLLALVVLLKARRERVDVVRI
jgi:hypothetical protein